MICRVPTTFGAEIPTFSSKSLLEAAIGVDAGWLKSRLDGMQLLLFLAAAGGISAAVATIITARQRR